MQIKKINSLDLKKLEKTPIWEERTTLTVPFIVVNQNNEVLFGENSKCSLMDAHGDIECIVIDCKDNIESRKIAFQLHYLGMTAVVGFENFNDLAISQTGGPYDLYLWDTAQFEKTYSKKVKEEIKSEETLF